MEISSLNQSVFSLQMQFYGGAGPNQPQSAGGNMNIGMQISAPPPPPAYSNPANIFGGLQQLHASDPGEFSSIMSGLSEKLYELASSVGDEFAGSFLSDLADKFSAAAETGNLAGLNPPLPMPQQGMQSSEIQALYNQGFSPAAPPPPTLAETEMMPQLIDNLETLLAEDEGKFAQTASTIADMLLAAAEETDDVFAGRRLQGLAGALSQAAETGDLAALERPGGPQPPPQGMGPGGPQGGEPPQPPGGVHDFMSALFTSILDMFEDEETA